MCGRYYRRSGKQKIAESFHIVHGDDVILAPWDYNIAPTTHIASDTESTCCAQRASQELDDWNIAGILTAKPQPIAFSCGPERRPNRMG